MTSERKAFDTSDSILKQFKSTLIPFQDVVNNALLQSNQNVDEDLWRRLSHVSSDDIATIKTVMYPFEKKKEQHPNQLTAREYFVLGNYYQFFICNFSEAVVCYKKAEALGDIGVLNNLGFIYMDGIGVEKDMLLARQYLEKASEKNNSLAVTNFYHYYLEIHDPVKAEFYIRKAAFLNNNCRNAHGLYLLGNKYKNNEVINYQGSEIERLRTAKFYLETAIANGSIGALRSLTGFLHYNTHRNLDTSLYTHWQQCISYCNALMPYSAECLEFKPEKILGDIYLALNDYQQAVRNYEKLILTGNKNAYKLLADLYLSGGCGLNQDLNTAAKYYFMAWENAEFSTKYLIETAWKVKQEYPFADRMAFIFYAPVAYTFKLGEKLGFEVDNLYTRDFYKDLLTLSEYKLDNGEYYFDNLAEETLYYIEKIMDLENNPTHQKMILRLLDKLKSRDKLLENRICANPTSIVNLYLLGSEGYQIKNRYISFFVKKDDLTKQQTVLALAKQYYHADRERKEFQEEQKFLNEKLLQLIDEKQINQNRPPQDDETGNTALHYMAASQSPMLNIIEKLCLLTYPKPENKNDEDSFASLENKMGDTPLILAIQHKGSPQIIDMLIHNQHYSDKQYGKALHYLIKHNQYGFAKNLLKINPKIAELTFNWEDTDTGNNALHLLMLNPDLELIKTLLTVPSSIRKNKNGESALFIAASLNRVDVFQHALSEPGILKLYDDAQLQKIILKLLENKQFLIAHNILKTTSLHIPSSEWTPIFLKQMSEALNTENKDSAKNTVESKNERVVPQIQLESKENGLSVAPIITGLESKTPDLSKTINIEFELFKLLSKNIFSEKIIKLTKQTKNGDNILTIAMKIHKDEIAIFVITHFNPLFEKSQYDKMFKDIITDNNKYHFAPKVIYALLEKASYNLSRDMMKSCISIFIENSRLAGNIHNILPHPKFLDYLPGNAERKRNDALNYITFILDSAKTTQEIMDFIIEFAKLKQTMRFFYPADDKPRKEIINYAKKKMLILIEKDPSQLDDQRVVEFIISSAGNDSSYANKLKEIKKKQLEHQHKRPMTP